MAPGMREALTELRSHVFEVPCDDPPGTGGGFAAVDGATTAHGAGAFQSVLCMWAGGAWR